MASRRLRHKIAGLLILLLAAAAPMTADAEEISPEPTGAVRQTPPSPEGEEGFASYYARRYHNRRTNSGQRHNAAALTAAHPTLPHGTKVKVINLANSREVTVTVNDRCRPRKIPFIDLSRAAAKQLGFLGKGKTRVRIIPLVEP